jgi:hypothetical protein
MVDDIIGFFNRRTKAKDLTKEASTERKTLAIQNGEAASRLMKNQDFALLFNLYRFGLLESLEDSKDDSERISNAHRVAGVRDFITYIEQVEYHGKIAVQRSATHNEKE